MSEREREGEKESERKQKGERSVREDREGVSDIAEKDRPSENPRRNRERDEREKGIVFKS